MVIRYLGFGQKEFLRYCDFSFSSGSHPPSWDLFGEHLDQSRRVLGGIYHGAKFGCDRCYSLDRMKVSIFGAIGLKKAIHVPKIWGLV